MSDMELMDEEAAQRLAKNHPGDPDLEVWEPWPGLPAFISWWTAPSLGRDLTRRAQPVQPAWVPAVVQSHRGAPFTEGFKKPANGVHLPGWVTPSADHAAR